MRWKYHSIRLLEVAIIFASCFLAVNSFFHSFIYKQAKEVVARALSRFDISYTIAVINPDIVLPVLISVLVFITATYFWLFGSRDKIISIYHFNMILFIPEALSFSKLDWMRLFDVPQTFFLSDRTFMDNLFTALVIMCGYVTLFMTNRFLETIEANEKRGALQIETDLVFINQSTISYSVLIASFLVIFVASYIVPFMQSEIHRILQTQQYRYIILGLVSTIIISASLLIYYREQISPRTTNIDSDTTS
jgi:hypothetical protein